MNYLEWNSIITKYFFNADNAGKDIPLYSTKQDIINLGKTHLGFSSDEEIWADFINAIIYEKQGNDKYKRHLSPIKKPLQLFNNWDKEEIPPFTAYLVLYIIPLTETYQTHFSTTNYYDRVNRFFKKNKILNEFVEKKIGTTNFQKISHLWNELEKWTIITKNCDLGIFELKEYGNPNWIHVCKPLSQCVFTPYGIERLPDLFLKSEMVPDSHYSNSEIKKYLLLHGASVLGLSVNIIKLIRKSDSDQLGHSIIEVAKREYNKWNGESNQLLTAGKNERLKKMLFPGRLYLQFKINSIAGSIEFSYRTKFNQDYPDNLRFEDLEIGYEKNKFSQTISLPYHDTFELIDVLNKWIAKFQKKEIRLFHGASNLQLSSDYWIETDTLSRNDWMYLLCENKYAESIINWGTQNCEEFINESDLNNIIEGFSLFKFLNPLYSHIDIPLLTVNTTKSIKLIGGLKTTFRVFLSDLLPEVEVQNATGKEQVFLQYKNDKKEIELIQKNKNSNRWLLPKNIINNYDFYIKLKDEAIEGYDQAYQLCEPDYTNLSNDIVQRRNRFDSVNHTSETYLQGNKVTTANKINTIIDGQSFLPMKKNNIIINKYSDYEENLLLKWLVAKQQCNLQTFNEIFETLYHDLFKNEDSKLYQKRQSTIYFMDNLGYIDYDYSNNKITALPPKLVLIPSQQNRKVMLIGGRDDRLVKNIIDYCRKIENDVSITIRSHNNKISQLLIPDTILLDGVTDKEIQNISQSINVEFDKWYILRLKYLVPSLKDYEKYVLENNRSDSQEDNDWARQVFDLNTLQFIHQKDFDKTYTLVEYSYTTYWKEYGLWINDIYYKVDDKKWGKYLVLNEFSEKESGYDREAMYSKPREIYFNTNCLAIPASLPLPKIMSRILLQISGDLPNFKQLKLNDKSRWYNVYKNLPTQFIENFFRFKLNMNIERTTLKI